MLHSLTKTIIVSLGFYSLVDATGLVDVRRHPARYPVPGTVPLTLQDPQKRAEGLYERQSCLEQQTHCDFGRCCFGDCCVNACCPPGYRCHIVGNKHGCCFAGVNCSDYFEGCVYSSGVQCEDYDHCCPAGEACGLDANGNATCDGRDAIAGLNPRNPYTPTRSASSTTSSEATDITGPSPPGSSEVTDIIGPSTLESSELPSTSSISDPVPTPELTEDVTSITTVGPTISANPTPRTTPFSQAPGASTTTSSGSGSLGLVVNGLSLVCMTALVAVLVG